MYECIDWLTADLEQVKEIGRGGVDADEIFVIFWRGIRELGYA